MTANNIISLKFFLGGSLYELTRIVYKSLVKHDIKYLVKSNGK